MNPTESSCEITSISETAAPCSPAGSRVLPMGDNFRWEGASVTEYKERADHWCGVLRTVLVGESGEPIPFQVRYFEIAPAGFSSRESHSHEHAVIVLRGRGEVQLGESVHELGFGDVVYVAPHEVHQFRNQTSEPFGFLCIVDARRGSPSGS
jgi:quercetin dioxygenase-like cupin family protein